MEEGSADGGGGDLDVPNFFFFSHPFLSTGLMLHRMRPRFIVMVMRSDSRRADLMRLARRLRAGRNGTQIFGNNKNKKLRLYLK